MPTEDKAKLPRAQRIAVICHGAYVLHAQARWKDDKDGEHETAWSGDVPVGQSWVVDMSQQKGITTGRKMWLNVQIVAGKGMSGEVIEYAPNGQTITFEAKGTTLIGNRLDRI